MAANFRILQQESGQRIHLKLHGDFDGTSAFELVNKLKSKKLAGRQLIIHTDSLKSVLPFALGIFHCNFSNLPIKSSHICFTGRHAEDIAPKGCRIMISIQRP